MPRKKALTCPYAGCRKSFDNEHGLKTHVGRKHVSDLSGTKRTRFITGVAIDEYGCDSESDGDDDASDGDDEGDAAPVQPSESRRRRRAQPSYGVAGTSRPSSPSSSSSSSDLTDSEDSEANETDELAVSGRDTSDSNIESDYDRDGRPAGAAAAAPGALAAVAVMQAAAAQALQQHAVAAQAPEPPIDTGIYAHPKTPRVPVAGLNFSCQALGGHLLRHESNAAGTDLIRILKHPQFNAADLPLDAGALKRRIAKQMRAELPLSAVTVRKLPLSTLETQPPPKPWRNATVASRGVVPCLVSMLTNPRVISWDRLLKFDPAASPVPPGEADEPFHASVCREGCAAAIARGVALGWDPEHILPVAVMHSADGMTPDLTGRTKLDPIAMFLANLPYDIRRSVIAGEHVFLLPEILLGKIRTAKLKRDQRRAIQVGRLGLCS
jgi:hypothetical protein